MRKHTDKKDVFACVKGKLKNSIIDSVIQLVFNFNGSFLFRRHPVKRCQLQFCDGVT